MLRRSLIAAGLLAAGFAPGLASGAAAAQDASPAADACAAPTREDVERIPHLFAESLNSDDVSPYADLLAPDVVHHGSWMGNLGSAEEMTQGLQDLLTAFPDLTVDIEIVVAEAPYVAASWTASGTQDGPFVGYEASGRSGSWHGINMWRIDCGKIVESWSQPDQITRLQVIGAIPVDDAAAAAASPAAAAPAASPETCEGDGADPREVIARLWDEGWSGGDAAALEAVLAPGVIHHWATGADSVGVAATAERVEGWRQAMPDMTLVYDDIIVDGDYAAAAWTVTGTPAGAPDGTEPVSADGINIFRFECGQIAEMWSEMDALGLMAQLEAATAEATPAP